MFWVAWSRGAVQIISFLCTLVVARLLSPADFGLMALAGIWTAMIALVADMGMGAAILQFRTVDDRELADCFWLTMIVAAVAYGALCAAAPSIAGWFASPQLVKILVILGLSLPLNLVRTVPDSLLRRQLAFDRISQAEIASAVMTIPIVLGLAWAGAGVWALVAGALVTPSVQSLVTFWFMPWWPGWAIHGRRTREMVQYGIAVLGTRLCWAAYQQADLFVLGRASGQVAVGYYSMAMQLATLPAERVAVVVNQIASAVLARLQVDPVAMERSTLRGVRLVAWATLPLCIGLMLVADDFIRVAFTEKWSPLVPVLRVLCLYAGVRSLLILFPPLLMARYRTRFLFVYNVALLFAMPLAFWLGARWGQSLGVAIAWTTIYPILALSMVREALREIGVSWKGLAAELWGPATATLFMAAVVALVRWRMPSVEGASTVTRLGMTVASGAMAYGFAFLAVGGPVRAELVEVAGWLVGRASVASETK